MKRRSILWMVFLFVVTLGLYRIYWLIKTRSEMLSAKPKLKIVSPVFILVPLLLMTISVGALIKTSHDARNLCLKNQASGIASSAVTCSEPQVNNPSDWAIALFYITCGIYIPLQAIYIWGYSKAVSDITKDRMSFPLAMLLLLVLPYGFDMLLIQEAFNEVKPRKKDIYKKLAAANA